MEKIDFKKEWKELYQPSRSEWRLVNVPDLQYLMVDGHGDPNTAVEYTQALEALYAVAYRLKFFSKKQGRDYVVPPLEGLWWAENMDAFSAARNKSQWDWTMMIMTPDWITHPTFLQAQKAARDNKELPAARKLQLKTYREGLSVQILHLGSYDEEGPALAHLHQEWMPENGFDFNGKHHEVYLNDPRKVAPDKLKTILRQPVRKK
jgi:hypothetical protein